MADLRLDVREDAIAAGAIVPQDPEASLLVERILSEDAVRQLNEKLERRVEKRTAELAESSRRHETLLANLQGMAFRCRIADGWAMRYVSEGCRQLLGVEPTELISGRCTLFSLIHRADLAEVEHVWEQCIADGRPIQHEYRVLRPDGKQRWVWEQSRLVRGVAGEPEAIEGFITDVTVAKMAALRQANQSRLYELLAVGSPVEDALRHIARSLEAEDPSSYCVISLPEETNGNGGLAAAPSLPAAFKEALVVDLQRERQRWNAAFRGAEKSQHRRMVGVPQSGMGSDRPQE